MSGKSLVVDFSILNIIYAQGNCQESLGEKISAFLLNSRQKLMEVKTGILNSDNAVVLRSLTWLGKSGAALGAWNLSEICAELGAQVEAKEEEEIREKLKELAREIAQVNADLDYFCENKVTFAENQT